jgi:hypothetical protein
MCRLALICVTLSSLFLGQVLPSSAAEKAPPRFDRRWFYAPYNLLVDKNVDQLVALIHRAGKSGYNGVMLADYKFNILNRMPKNYFQNVARVRREAAAAHLEIIPAVCPIGYSAGLLAHDPNLAEGVPVKDAPFVVKGGRAVSVPDPDARIKNGDLEEEKGHRFARFSFQDGPGKSSFADRQVVHHGKVSCRMQDVAKSQSAGNCRLIQRVKVRPYTCYRFSCWVKTRDFKPVNAFRLVVLGASKADHALSFFEEPLQSTGDWTRVEVVFNSLAEKEVTLYAGQWGGRSGTLWLDDLALEELSLVNVLRRPGCPLVVASEDSGTVYKEGKDYDPVRDPKLGQDPYAGEYSFRHAGPPIRLTPKSRIEEGDKLRLSWYHPLPTHSYQVMCCLSEPRVYEILRDQVKRVNDLFKPKTLFMSHDEIRVANWCRACQSRKLTPGALLADNVRRCVQIIKDVNPKAQIVVWSDMFDPHHNAVDNYYLVNGSLKGSWQGLPAGVRIANWNSGKAAASLKWFAGRGHIQLIAGYYDGDLDNFKQWQAAAKGIPRVTGFMYTTWQNKYDHLEAYGKALLGLALRKNYFTKD